MSWSILVSSYDRKAERTARFNKKKQSKNKARTKGYRKEQLQEKDDIDDIKNWKAGFLRDSD
jgi:hypothetical protein